MEATEPAMQDSECMFIDNMLDNVKEAMINDAKRELANMMVEMAASGDEESEPFEKPMTVVDKTEALQLFQQGKRNLLVEDFDAAVETLASACEKYTAIYGELSAECGEVFMTYGNALIQLWRNEEANSKKEDEELKSINDNVEGKKENGVATEMNGEQNEEETMETNDEKLDDDDEESSKVNGETAAETEGESVEDAAESEKSSGEEAAQPADDTIEDSVEENNDEDDDCEEDEDVDNLQLAWEIFETAKTIYTKHNDDANLAKVYTKLGEISIASGNYELAIEDLKKSLDILNKVDSAKARQVADTHFQLYAAYSANYNFDLAELELRNAKNTLDEQVRTLQGKSKDLAAESDEAKQINNEIKELEKLTKDMQEKLNEFTASKRKIVTAISTTILSKMENQKQTPSIGETAGSSASKLPNTSTSSSKLPVNNISHLIRKKPKNSEDEKRNTMTNGLKSNEDTRAEKAEESVDANEDSQKCKRKADDESDQTEPSAKKQCVS